MTLIIKGALLLIFLFVIFGQGMVASKTLYWSLYFVMFALIPLLWKSMFSVSEKQAKKVLDGESLDFNIFVGKVPANPQDDLLRGRLCFTDGSVKLVSKTGNRYSVTWEAEIKDITSVSFGTVAGIRKGFTLSFKDSEASFTSVKIYKQHDLLCKALNWNIT